MIEINQVEKYFVDKKRGRVAALNNVSMRFDDGSITALLGINGAGKSTLIRLIQGTMRPDSGRLLVDGCNVQDALAVVRGTLGVLGDDVGLYKNLTARENIEYFGQLQGLSNKDAAASAAWLIEQLNMQAIADRRTQGFSQGERMKTCLARVLVHRPKNILLDEPLNGLDVFTARDVKQLLKTLASAGHCIVISSHQMLEIENLCDRVAMIHGGKCLYAGSLVEARELFNLSALEDIFVTLVQQSRFAQDKGMIDADH